MRTSTHRYALLVAASIAVIASTAATSATRAAVNQSATIAPTCGNAQLVKSTGAFWQCTFDDEFSSTTLDSTKWSAQVTSNSSYHIGPECFVNTANNISVANGTLNLTARKESAPFTCTSPSGNYTSQYTSGMVTSYLKFNQAFGRFEVRAKLPAAKVAGLQESFWLWPTNWVKYGPYPMSGEIDFAEIYSRYADRAIPYIHYVPAILDLNITNNYCMITDISQFHTYALEWTTSSLKIIYDGKTCLVDKWVPISPLISPMPFDQPFFLALTQALGIGVNAFNAATTPLPATTAVDYVRVWK